LELVFTSKAGETGKLYGSITTQSIVEAINKKLGTTLDRRQVEAEPIRTLGEHSAHVRLTIDLTPKVTVKVYREGEEPEIAPEPVKAAPVVETPVAEAPAEEPATEEKAE
jgi:large subunit ribosomal protein L9